MTPNLHVNDEIIPRPIKGVRFWSYQLVSQGAPSPYNAPPRTITSFQADIEWLASRPAQSDMAPTMGNERGLNVYKTERDALAGSADAVNGVIESVARWTANTSGLVLGTVELWGDVVEHERGYHAHFVKPTKFTRAWGYEPEQMVADLNLLWFGEGISLSYSERIMLAIQRSGVVTVADIPNDKIRQTITILERLETKGFVTWWRASYDDGVIYKRQKDAAWEQGECLSCHRPARADGACRGGRPRLYQLTLAGQDALLVALRGKNG